MKGEYACFFTFKYTNKIFLQVGVKNEAQIKILQKGLQALRVALSRNSFHINTTTLPSLSILNLHLAVVRSIHNIEDKSNIIQVHTESLAIYYWQMSP